MPDRFLDKYLPAKTPGVGVVASPRWKTTIQTNASGREIPNQEWESPLHRFTLPEAVRDWDTVSALQDFWMITRGPFRSWPWRNPLDFASCDLVKPNKVPTVHMNDQLIGTVDGFTNSWQLKKTYSYDGETFERVIHLPVLDSVIVAIDGVLVDVASYSVSRPGGVVTFGVPPDPSDYDEGIITAGFLFDCEVRFESDDVFDQVLRAHHAGGFADLSLIEVRPC